MGFKWNSIVVVFVQLFWCMFVVVKWKKQLFTKNTGQCKVEKQCILTDMCPMLVFEIGAVFAAHGTTNQWRT